MTSLLADRKRIITELRKQLDFTRAISQNLGEGLIALDAEGCVTFMNPAAEHILGWTEEELFGRQLHEVLHFRQAEHAEHNSHDCQLREMVQSSDKADWTNDYFTRKNGTLVPVAFEVSPFAPNTELSGVVIAFRDVSAQLRLDAERQQLLARERQARADAEAAQRRLAFLAEASVVLASSLDDDVTLDALARLIVPRLADWCLLGLPQADGDVRYLVATPQGALPLTPSRPTALADNLACGRLHRLLGDGLPELLHTLPSPEAETSALRDLGLDVSDRLHSCIVVPLVARERRLGAMALYRAVATAPYTDDDLALVDALAQRAALARENALLYRETRDALNHRDAFLGIASHELKTPLTSLKVATQLTVRRLKGRDDGCVQYAKRLEAAIARMERLVGDLLDVSRIQAGKLDLRPGLLDLAALCVQVTEEVGAANGRAITVQSAEQPVQVQGDSDHLQQVLYNLLANALKYSETNTPISVSVTCDQCEARVTVRDAGVGIPQEELPHLFERFYQAPDVAVQNGSHVGLGLGLFISREVIERHGGRIWLESTPGEGTRATFTLPLA